MTADNRFVQFNRTKMCKFEVLGRCKKGRECPFAHTSRELKALPDLRCTKLCKSIILTGICADDTCNFAHSKDELRSTGTFHKTKLCRFMQTGHCALGAKCNFAHSSSELRQTDAATVLQAKAVSKSQKTDDAENGALGWQGMAAPPGLGWESIYAGTGAVNSDVTDLSGLAQALDVMLSQQQAAAEALDSAKAATIQSGSPAYVHLSSSPKAHGDSDGSGALGTLSFDYLNAEIQSMSTRSPQSPPTPPSPSGSRSSSGKSASGKSAKVMSAVGCAYTDQEAAMPVYFAKGPFWESPTHGAGMGMLGPMWSFGPGAHAGMDPRLAAYGGHPALATGPLSNDHVGA